jgi:hypothetical protein
MKEATIIKVEPIRVKKPFCREWSYKPTRQYIHDWTEKLLDSRELLRPNQLVDIRLLLPTKCEVK